MKTQFIKIYLCIIPIMILSSCVKKSYPIAYSLKESDRADIYLSNKKGKSKIKITNGPDGGGYPAWSPDGKLLALYAYHDGGKTWSIHTMNIDGTNRKRLTNATNNWDSTPTWSHDGEKIAFGRSYKNSDGIRQEEIWIMNSDGSNEEHIKPLYGGAPQFMQDGRILFHSKTKFSEICIANSDGSNLIKLTDNDAEDWHPEVSPDGKQIAFMSDRDGNREIYTMNIDGSNQKRLTFNDDEYWGPSWSPDGSKLIFSSYEDDGEKNIYLIKKDGSAMRKIIKNGAQPSWLKMKKH